MMPSSNSVAASSQRVIRGMCAEHCTIEQRTPWQTQSKFRIESIMTILRHPESALHILLGCLADVYWMTGCGLAQRLRKDRWSRKESTGRVSEWSCRAIAVLIRQSLCFSLFWLRPSGACLTMLGLAGIFRELERQQSESCSCLSCAHV